jgi:hypothetical protein
MLGIQQAGAGTGVRTVADKALETLSVEDFYQLGDDDAAAWQKALDALHDNGGGVLVATRPSYDLSAELFLSGLGIERVMTVDARGALFTTQTGVPGVMTVEGNGTSSGIYIKNFVVDHTMNTTAVYGFRQRGTACVRWPGCFVRGGAGHPSEYGGWLVTMTDPDDVNTGCFWTNFDGARVHGELGDMPTGVILEGTANATDFYGYDSRSCVNHIVMRAPAASTLPDDDKPTPNSVRVVGAYFEAGGTGVVFEGVSGSYGPYGLLVDSRFEAVETMVSLQGATKSYRQPPTIIVSQTMQSVSNVVVNPENIQCNVFDLRSTSGLTEVNTRGWRFRGTDAGQDVVEIDLANVGHGLRMTLGEDVLATLRYVASGVTELAGGSGSIGIAHTRVRGVSGTGTRARNFSGYVSLAAESTKVIDLPFTEPDNEFGVILDVPDDVNWWVTSKSTTQFTMNFSSPVTGAVRWLMFR